MFGWRTVGRGLAFLGVCLSAVPAAAVPDPQTGLWFESQPGEFLANGASEFRQSPDWSFSLDATNPVTVSGTGPLGKRFVLQFAGPHGDALAPGPYEDAYRAPYARASPGLDLFLDYGCGTTRGRFVVLEIALDAVPPRLAVNFEQSCGPPLYGEIRLNSTVPYTFQAPHPTTLPDAMGFGAAQPVHANTFVYSNYSRVYGTNAPVPISISGGGEYSINEGPFTSAPGTAQPRDRVRLRLRSSLSPGAINEATFDAGGRLATFSVRTYAPGTPMTGLFIRDVSRPMGSGAALYFPAPANPPYVSRVGDGTAIDGITMNVAGVAGLYFAGNFYGPGFTTLLPGTYEGVQEFPTSTNPGAKVFGDLSLMGCEIVYSRLIVQEVEYAAPGGDVSRLALDLEQRCEGFYPPILVQLRYNSTVPLAPLVASQYDVSGEGRDDIFWEHTDGRAAVWLMNGLAVDAGREIIGPGTGWSVVRVADLDGDGKGDLVWQHADGRIAIWLMNGSAPKDTVEQGLGAGWTVRDTPDLNGDGRSDLVLEHQDGRTIAFTMLGGIFRTNESTLMGPATGWNVIRTADFDGDGNADLLWKHPDGRHAIWLMNGVEVKAMQQILDADEDNFRGWTVTHTGDFNGDGKADLVWRSVDRGVAIWLMNGTAIMSGAEVLPPVPMFAVLPGHWLVTHVGDFNGDGKSDLLFTHSSEHVALWLMNGLATASSATIFTGPDTHWSVNRLTDLNGDGKSDIVWQNTDGRIAVWLMDGTTMASGAGILGPSTGWSVSAAQ